MSLARLDQAKSRHVPAWNPYLTQQSIWGNQALQRLLRKRAIQAKLKINEAGDTYEQEAVRVAEESSQAQRRERSTPRANVQIFPRRSTGHPSSHVVSPQVSTGSVFLGRPMTPPSFQDARGESEVLSREAYSCGETCQACRANAETSTRAPTLLRGEDPQPQTPRPAPENAAPETTTGECGCSNLRLVENLYDEQARKHVKIQFDVAPGADPHQCVLVQYVKGEKYIRYASDPTQKWHPTVNLILGEAMTWNFDDWVIDSPDKDPVYWSEPGERWRYKSEGERSYSATDKPDPITPDDRARMAVSDVKFRTSLYCANDVPTTLAAGQNLGSPLASVEWEESTCWQKGSAPTHPGFGKPCPWATKEP